MSAPMRVLAKVVGLTLYRCTGCGMEAWHWTTGLVLHGCTTRRELCARIEGYRGLRRRRSW